MKFTDLFVKRPVLAMVVNLVILIAGLQAIRSLSVRQYPRSDIAVVQITTVYVGADADLVRGFVTTPIERVVASADGIDYMESTSAQGLSTIQVHLKINYDTTTALTQIQAKVAQVRNDLPPDAQIPVIDLQTADTQFAAVYLGFSSKDLDQNQITDYLTRVVQPKLSAISGVQRADILGNRTFAMRLWLKTPEMAARVPSPAAPPPPTSVLLVWTCCWMFAARCVCRSVIACAARLIAPWYCVDHCCWKVPEAGPRQW